MSEVKEWYKNAWYTPTMKKIKEGVDAVNEKVNKAIPESPTDDGEYSLRTSVVDGKATSSWAEYKEGGETYSTTETVVGTWIDGRPVYEIVLTNSFTSSTNNWTNINMLNANDIELVIFAIGFQTNEPNWILAKRFPRVQKDNTVTPKQVKVYDDTTATYTRTIVRYVKKAS